jgi:Fur family zinc uptake transcriptional regulator
VSTFPDHHHDHDRCVADALSAAEIVCSQRGARLTDLRRRVLELIWDSHAPIGAYDHRGYFLICQGCGAAHELAGGALDRELRASAEDLNFQIRRITIEVAGLCAECAAAAHS